MAARAIGGSTRVAGVIGWPVAHSRSPRMHNAAFAALGMDWVYVALAVAPERLSDAVQGLPALGMVGVNVTIPHKQAVGPLCDHLTARARRAGSVNTVTVAEDGSLHGDTTDGAGMLDAVGEVSGGGALVVGAGGAARAAVAALVDAGHRVVVCARRDDAARDLAAQLGATAEPWPPRPGAALVVNATPVGQSGDADELPVEVSVVEAAVLVCDLAYRADGVQTGLVTAARRAGTAAVDGLDVLVAQGAHAFRLFTGADPPLDVMRAAVRENGPEGTTLGA